MIEVNILFNDKKESTQNLNLIMVDCNHSDDLYSNGFESVNHQKAVSELNETY